MVEIDQECCRAIFVLHDAPLMEKKALGTVLDGFRPGQIPSWTLVNYVNSKRLCDC